MQRITRMLFDPNDLDKISLFDQYNSVLQLLKPNVSERSFSILAIPRLIEGDHYLGWYTHLEGQPVAIEDIINEADKKQIEKTLQTRLNDIENTIKIKSLTEDQQTLISAWLPRMRSLGNVIYVINNEPVIVHHFDEPILTNEVAPALPVKTTKSFWRRWWFLTLALAFVGLLGYLYYLYTIDKAPVPIAELLPPTTSNNSTSEVISCISQEEIQKNEQTSKMVMIFDNSASMYLTLTEPQAEIEKYLSNGIDRLTFEEAKQYEERMTRLPNRLSSSKQVALSSIDKIQPNINIALVTLNSCPVAKVSAFYHFDNREKLKNEINRLTPLEYDSATPLYSGVKQASSMLDGVNHDDYILIISDGDDNCSEDNICTLANEIANQQPRLKINIVDIVGQHKIDCLADKTGGKVYIANNVTELVEQMNKAVSDMNISKPLCE
ncbi:MULTISPECIES: vWA domain-containing protein [unclassified Gilliamella]|uniref:vWA domain-containing protein n=1 Tax=unclassified Gilliamella TaxID=2685620 RepID=UPI00226AB016|nr:MULTISPECIES: VWA domain-containing protein [unclassified Gilliamella]MCX8574184.1 VWA domain-containing protein [Gilliamella sp. B3831]MCX8576415.1 VWA domain-containing protein [Gilliamella sp. B3815]MCX8590916.1 VWA domain-containing protein [Gilliamella sp. B3812]MCX8603698.1 VWA domain-containing protein [Gilliamella sp. B3823]MCX8606090.1 VWA domain-containing protein [Gilliamella sp. B3825]